MNYKDIIRKREPIAPRTPPAERASKEDRSIAKLNKHDYNGETKLHIASRLGDLDRVTTLLKRGAFVDVKCNAGYTPLHEVKSRVIYLYECYC